VWNNPNEIDVTFVPDTRISFVWMIILIAILIVIGVVALVIKSRSSQNSEANIFDFSYPKLFNTERE